MCCHFKGKTENGNPGDIYFHVCTENGTNGKWQLSFVCCKRKTDMANLRASFLQTENRKRKFILHGRQTINGN